MDPENNKKLEQYKNSSKRESEGTAERPEMRTHADFEVLITQESEDALRKTNGDYLKNEEIRTYVREFFTSHLGAGNEKADAVAGTLKKQLRKLAPLIAEKKELKKQEHDDTQKKRIQEIEREVEAVRKRVIKTLARSIQEVLHGESKQDAEQQKTAEERAESTKEKEDTDRGVDKNKKESDNDSELEELLNGDGKNTEDGITLDVPSNPEKMKTETFDAFLQSENGEQKLQHMIDWHAKEIRGLYEKKGIRNETEVLKREKSGELSELHWTSYKRAKERITKFLKEHANAPEYFSYSEQVIGARYREWVEFFERVNAIISVLKNYTPEDPKPEKTEADTSDGVEEGEAGASSKVEGEGPKAPPTQQSKPSDTLDQKGDKSTKLPDQGKQEPKPREPDGQQEHSEVDPEFKKEIEDALEAIDTEIAETFPHPEALPRSEKYQQLQQYIHEVRADLNEKDPDEDYGMYGHRSYKDKIEDKIDAIRELKHELFADFDAAAERTDRDSSGAQKEEEGTEMDQVEKGKRMVEVPAGEGEPVSYEAARAEWKAARAEWKRVKDEYESALSAHYQKAYGNALQRGVYHISSIFGGSQSFPEHIREFENQYTKARRDYMQSIKSVLAARAEDQGEGHKDNFEFEAEGIRSAVGNRFVLDAIRRRKEIRDSVFHPDDSEAKVRAQLRQAGQYLKEHKWSRRVGQLAMVGIATGLTGGIAGALVATSHRAVGMVGGAALGATSGMTVWSLFGRSVRGHEEAVSETKEKVKTDVDVDSFREQERQLMEQEEKLERRQKQQKAATAGAAVAGGMLGGAAFSDAADALDSMDKAKDATVEDGAGDAQEPAIETPRSAPEPNVPLEEPAAETVVPEQSTEAVPPPVEATTDATEDEETQEVFEGGIYEVQKGDNLWNILEGDVEGRGMSEVLERIPEAHRNEALDALFDRVDSDESLREAIGMRSSNADTIYYDLDGKGNGEQLNITALEQALAEVATEKGFISGESVPQELDTSGYERPGPDDGLQETPDTSGYERPGPDDGLRGSEDTSGYERSGSDDGLRAAGAAVGAAAGAAAVPQSGRVQTDESLQRITERIPKERIAEVKQEYIKEHLKEQGGFLGTLLSSDTPNAYEILQNTQMEDIAEMDSVPEGMTESQWAKLVAMLQDTSETTVPDQPDETLSEYMDRFAREHELKRLSQGANDDSIAPRIGKAA